MPLTRLRHKYRYIYTKLIIFIVFYGLSCNYKWLQYIESHCRRVQIPINQDAIQSLREGGSALIQCPMMREWENCTNLIGSATSDTITAGVNFPDNVRDMFSERFITFPGNPHGHQWFPLVAQGFRRIMPIFRSLEPAPNGLYFLFWIFLLFFLSARLMLDLLKLVTAHYLHDSIFHITVFRSDARTM